MLRILSIGILALCNHAFGAPARTLDIYHIDVEGGAATLIVTPAGESLLVDTGNPGNGDRDAKRIYAAAHQAGLKKIDALWITHFHGDHVGGLPALEKMIPIGRYYDHGDSVEPSVGFEACKKLSEGKRTSVKPGELIPMKGIAVQVTSAHGERLTKPINGGGPNPLLCQGAQLKQADGTDNARSAGFLLTFGKFQFLDLGDLTWNKENDLVCPQNLLGKVDVYQVTHHGLDLSSPPQLVWAIQPRVAIMNNGPRKGGATSVFEVLRKSPGMEDVWQLHFSEVAAKDSNSAESLIANPVPTAECKGNWIKVSVEKSGKYTVTNSRNNFSKSYAAR